MSHGATKTTMEHNGYTASVEWDAECGCYSGIVMDAWGTVVFSGDTLEEAHDRFKGILDWYLEDCQKDGVEPRLSNREEMAHSSRHDRAVVWKNTVRQELSVKWHTTHPGATTPLEREQGARLPFWAAQKLSFAVRNQKPRQGGNSVNWRYICIICIFGGQNGTGYR